MSWLFPLVDGHPPIGWGNAAAYLAMPVLLVLSQVRGDLGANRETLCTAIITLLHAMLGPIVMPAPYVPVSCITARCGNTGSRFQVTHP